MILQRERSARARARIRTATRFLASLLCVAGASPGLLAYQETSTPEKVASQEVQPPDTTLDLPYAFYNEFFGFAGGYVHAKSQFVQPQASLIGTAMAGTNGSGMVWGMLDNLRISGTERWFVDVIGQVGYFNDAKAYIDGDPDFPNQTAGANNSNENNFVEGDGWDNYFRANFKYVLPMGEGDDHILPHYKLDRGLPIDEGPDTGSWWNPFESGRTYAEVRPFYRSQEIDGDFVDETTKTNGFELGLFHDQRDYEPSPSRGGSVYLRAAYDMGWFDSSAPWQVYSIEVDKYVSLGATDTFRQRVLAFGFWASDTPSWNDTTTQDGQQVDERPPNYAGSTLGGLMRMRAYPTSRFHDRSAIYYCGELRLTPESNPFDDYDWARDHLGVSWWQWVGYAEVGRVSPQWNLPELHTDMKWDLGFGIRALASGINVRLEMAFGEEGAAIVMMIGQPFQFGS